jgi:acylphosphatase
MVDLRHQFEPSTRACAVCKSGVFVQKLLQSGYYCRMVCKKCFVGGRVQGVFYRGTAAARARELQIRGYARNLADGRVEVLACGEESAVATFVSWLWTGSSACKVTSVDVNDIAPESVQLTAGFFTS